MKKTLLNILFCGALLVSSHSALAQDNRFGIGAMINSPTGVSAKAWVNPNLAIDGAWSFAIAQNTSRAYFHTDVLHHGYAISNNQLRNYYGAGVRLLWSDLSNDLTIGLRGPVGITYAIENTDIVGFFELVPTLDFTPNTRFFFGGAMGIRVYIFD